MELLGLSVWTVGGGVVGSGVRTGRGCYII